MDVQFLAKNKGLLVAIEGGFINPKLTNNYAICTKSTNHIQKRTEGGSVINSIGHSHSHYI